MPKTSLANRYLQAWNSHDPDRVLSFFNKDATYVDSGLLQQVQGQMVGDYVEKIILLCPDVSFELLDGGITGNGRAAIQWRATGKELNRLCPQIDAGSIDTICGLDYIVHDHGQLLSTHVYFDLSPFLQTTHVSAIAARKHYQKSGLSEQELRSYQQQLNQLMQHQQLYLNNNLTLAELADELNLSSNHLSQVINSQFGFSYYELLNHYRIEKAKQLLQETDPQTSTLDIAFNSGFGSVSAFYRAFQQHVKMTPVQYRKRYC
ncbi:helix-turn-helix domain-containing protein [Aliamphritea ceti]|uniref:helix-turn-helix domain-containing protein n=1 Tax=Aliamphritea ceti TaxID=1524258 RepID=UPI0021C2E9B1|nr:helix-turn-helix domain-containing protein [Aliamphritea ceti]